MGSDIDRVARSEARRRSYRRNLHRALAVSVAVHLLAALGGNPDLVRRLLSRRVAIGYEGAPRPGELASLGEPRLPRSTLLPRHRRGSITLIQPVVIGTQGEDDPAAEKPLAAAGRFVPGPPDAAGRRGQPRSGEIDTLLKVELDESWIAVRGSGEVAFSESFRVLKIIRPEYPWIAVEAGIQGVVKLEAQVSRFGRVEHVRVLENSGDEELERAAVGAMYQWEFRPYRVNRREVPFTVIVPFRFRLIG
jgi:TonB family protein